ncbi:hydroxyisourate hydrolase [Spinellus fusiger]|nr:hydroxyisourate hydrolase [Spinellus fusiger]
MEFVKKSPITCHVLVTSHGVPAKNMSVKAEKLESYDFVTLSVSATDDDGRCPTLILPGHKLERGIYRLTFETKTYFESLGQQCFYPHVQITFELTNPEQHYHIPLLISPYGYTTYRGS